MFPRFARLLQLLLLLCAIFYLKLRIPRRLRTAQSSTFFSMVVPASVVRLCFGSCYSCNRKAADCRNLSKREIDLFLGSRPLGSETEKQEQRMEGNHWEPAENNKGAMKYLLGGIFFLIMILTARNEQHVNVLELQ